MNRISHPTPDIDVSLDELNEDSGLIDLRALLAQQRAAAAAGVTQPLVAHAPPLVAPKKPSRRPTPLLAWAASAAVFALSAMVYAATLPTAPAARIGDSEVTVVKDPPTSGGEAPIRAAVVPVAILPALAAAESPAPAAEPERVAPLPSRRVATRTAPAPASQERVAPAQSWGTGSSDGAEPLDGLIDALLDRALGSASSDPRLTESRLPATPTRGQVSTTLQALQGEVRQCAEDGVARVRLVVDGSTGRVSSASVAGLSGSSAACVADAVRTARFPRFERERFVIDYPYVL